MELGRERIDRSDFSTVRQGYDCTEVERHLERIAAAVAELQIASRERSVARSTAQKVEALLAEGESQAAKTRAQARRWAADSTDQAKEEADRTTKAASMAAGETYQRVDSRVGSYLEPSLNEVGTLRQRIANTTWKLEQVVDDAGGALAEMQSLKGTTSDWRQALERAQNTFAGLLTDDGGLLGAEPEEP